ncbi:MAG: HlyC/CorC family transporter [Candidatus Omnitrophica bacterium]|nr:HlyC/CorC family transporter [Candidatus Omnitrophota bacterium]
MEYILEIILLIFLLLLAAITAASETSLIAASRIRLRRLSFEGSKAAKIILKILETPEKFFGTILVANNIVDALIASLVTAVMVSLFREQAKGIVLATIVVSFLIIVSEVAAKTFAAKHSEKLSLSLARPVRFLIVIFSPVVKILALITNAIVRPLSASSGKQPSLVVEEEIKALITIGKEEDASHKEKYAMLSKVFKFNETLVKDVMIPKNQIVYIDSNANIEDIFYKVLESGYSRLPVYKDNTDSIIGVVNMKDLLNLSVNQELIVLQDIIYPATFVQGARKVSDLLKEFQKGHTHLALVVDEKNNIIGIITLEDLLEEIVGEIEDESDVRSV